MVLNICRLCLQEHQMLHNIFEYDTKELPNKIVICTTVQVLENDGLPPVVCINCIETIEHFFLFRKQCQYSDSIIKEKIANHLQIQSGDIEKSILFSNLKNSEINNEGLLITNSTVNDGDGTNNEDDDSDNYSDPDFEIESRAKLSKKKVLRKQKCKIKESTNKTKKEQTLKHHNLIYTEEDYMILGSQRKVRIYEMDDAMREIIGQNVYGCEICTKQFTTFFDYFDHQETHNGDLVFKCSNCTKVFASRKNLVEHDARHKIPCKICKLEVLPKSMPAHSLIHTDIYKCLECGMRHTSNASLEKHVKARHIGIKGFVCHVCGKQSSFQSSMNRHMAYHSNERPYKCKYCEFCAKTLNIVQVHTSRKHFAEKCVCEICAKLFKSQPSLIQHMKRIHTPRKHVCDICGKAFIERYNLNRHLKKHAGQRLHECKLCHKEFFTIRKLKEHMHSHRQGCVNCPKCGKEFFYKKYYNKHILKCTKTDDNIISNDNANLV